MHRGRLDDSRRSQIPIILAWCRKCDVDPTSPFGGVLSAEMSGVQEYSAVKLLGKGSFGKVWLVIDKRKKEHAVLKVRRAQPGSQLVAGHRHLRPPISGVFRGIQGRCWCEWGGETLLHRVGRRKLLRNPQNCSHERHRLTAVSFGSGSFVASLHFFAAHCHVWGSLRRTVYGTAHGVLTLARNALLFVSSSFFIVWLSRFSPCQLFCFEVASQPPSQQSIDITNMSSKDREATRNEVDLLRRLHHPAVVRFHRAFSQKISKQQQLCIVMDYCDGGDLHDRISARKKAKEAPFSEDVIMSFVVQLLLGLEFLHSRRVLHRDIKSMNLFLLRNGRLVLGDLGVSKSLEQHALARTQIGTPYNMSPVRAWNGWFSWRALPRGTQAIGLLTVLRCLLRPARLPIRPLTPSLFTSSPCRNCSRTNRTAPPRTCGRLAASCTNCRPWKRPSTRRRWATSP